MKRSWLLIGLMAAFLLAGIVLFPQGARTQEISMQQSMSFRVLFGVTDSEPTAWDGSVTVNGGQVRSIQGWRFAGEDSTDYRASWKLSTRRLQNRPAQQKKKGGAGGPMEDNGVIVTASLTSAQARFDVQTSQGGFSFTAQELPYGETKTALDGRVRIDRVPSSLQITTSAEEQDHPAMAQSGDEVYLAYVDFTHGDRSQDTPQQMRQEPKSFDFLARPVGGDQVKLMRYSKSRRSWSAAEPVSLPGQDIMRAAVAVDGKGRVWVVWSANRESNFDLYAKVQTGGKWSPEIRVTTDAGTDINPVAATDSTGRVWIAWQAFRNGNLEILAAAQNQDRFSAEQKVSFSPASDWDPAIAVSASGEVAVAWDTYDKGDYDVYLRRMRFNNGVSMDAPEPVAVSERFEARPSAAYDARGRVWVAYEASEVKWGKDFGAYETTGIGLYQGHNLRVQCLQAGASFTTSDDLAEALPGGRADLRRRRARQQANSEPQFPNADLAAQRAPSATPQPPVMARNSFPRLAVDGNGTVYLAYRTASPARSPVGSTWTGQVVYFDGQRWRGPIEIPHTDGLLDVRPALALLAPGSLLMVSTSDHRQALVPGGGRRPSDSINSDLYAAEIETGTVSGDPKLTALTVGKPAPSAAEVRAEGEQVALMRGYRAPVAGRNLRLMRGEFHRHTEMSGDGGNDGPLIDAYRYMIDAASMDWGGCCDHDNGGGYEYYWWTQQKLTDAYLLPGRYTPMFSYERSVRYPEGHRNTVFVRRGLRPLPRLAKVPDDAPPAPAPDTQMLYKFLRQYDGIVASHTSGTNMGTDWRDNDPQVEPVVEIYQGDRQNYEMAQAPRSNNEDDSIGGWQPLGFVSNALQKGYRLGFQASSDHISTHMSYCNLWVTEPTRAAVLEAFKKRRVYGATENILADVRSGAHFMGEEFTTSSPPSIDVKLWGTADFAKVHIIKDNQHVYSVEPKSKKVDFNWRDANAERGKTSYYYVRGEQVDGELVWVSPMWITLR